MERMKARRARTLSSSSSWERRASSLALMSLLLERQVPVRHRPAHFVGAAAPPAANDAAHGAASAPGDADARTPPFLPALRRRWQKIRRLDQQWNWSSAPLASEGDSHDGSSVTIDDTAAINLPNATSDWEPEEPSPGDRALDINGNENGSSPPQSLDSSITGMDTSATANSNAADKERPHLNDATSMGWINVDVAGVNVRQRYRRSSSDLLQHRHARPTGWPESTIRSGDFGDRWTTACDAVDNDHRRPWRSSLEMGRNDEPSTSCSVRVDPAAIGRLLALSSNALYCLGLATLGSLRLLAPLLVARRVLNALGELLMDWYRGYYLRTTYESMQLQYYHYIQGPAILRSVGRLGSQIGLLFVLGRVMEWMVGLSHAPCVIAHDDVLHRGGGSGGCHWWCGVLWLIAVVGTGHAGAAAIAVWGGPLRIQIVQSSSRWGGGDSRGPATGVTVSNSFRRPSARHIFTRPFRMLKWLRDPDQWIRAVAYNSLQQQRRRMRMYYSNHASTEPLRPFQPDPLLFPATWEPLRLLLYLGLANEMTSSRSTMHVLMRQILVQQSFADEWYRVLLCEKRIAIGIFVMAFFLLSSLNLFWTVLARTSDPGSDAGLSVALMIPYLFSVIVSGYMNVFFYNDIRRIKKQEAATRARPADFWLQGKFVLKSVQW